MTTDRRSFRGGYPVKPLLPRPSNVAADIPSTEMDLVAATPKTFYFAKSPDGSTPSLASLTAAAPYLPGVIAKIAWVTKLSSNASTLRIAWNTESTDTLFWNVDGLVNPESLSRFAGPCWCVTLESSLGLTWNTDFLIAGVQ